MSYPEHSLGKRAYISAETQSTYCTAPADMQSWQCGVCVNLFYYKRKVMWTIQRLILTRVTRRPKKLLRFRTMGNSSEDSFRFFFFRSSKDLTSDPRALNAWSGNYWMHKDNLQQIMDLFSLLLVMVFDERLAKKDKSDVHPFTLNVLQRTNLTCERHPTEGCWHFSIPRKYCVMG